MTHVNFRNSLGRTSAGIRKFVAVIAVLFVAISGSASAEGIRRIESDPLKGSSGAVIVPGDATLVHTAQLMPLDEGGAVLYAGDPYKQAETLFDLLDKVLKEAGASRESVVKLNVYLTDDEVGGEVRTEVRRRFGKDLPAVSYVRGQLPVAQVLLALDAVAVSSLKEGKVTLRRLSGVHPVPAGNHLAFMPAGRKAYVSGLAGKGAMHVASDETLKQLWSVLDFLKAQPGQIVQVKAFLNPMTEQKAVMEEIMKRFPPGQTPVIILVEWTSTIPVEIEMIVSLPASGEKLPVVEYLTPPGVQASPVYSRIARVNGGKDVHISGLFGEVATSGDVQLQAIFSQLKHLAESSGSDMRHLVKATYYVASDDTNRKLNEIRPSYYEAARPPAASKASVRGAGMPGRTVTLDMIAVTKE